MALLEELADLAIRIHRAQQLREAARLGANRLAAGVRAGQEEFQQILLRLEAERTAQEPYFVTALVEQLQGEEEALGPTRHWAQERLGKPLPELIREEHTKEAS